MMTENTFLKRLKGVIPVLPVPFTDRFEADGDGIFSMIEFLINAGVGGFWSLGSASEDINIPVRERVRIARITAEANNGRLPIIMGTGLTAIGDILWFFDEISDLKLDGVHVLPYDTKMGEKRLIHFFLTLADKAPFPVWLYHNPKRGKPITEFVIKEVKDHPNIGGIKVGGYALTELTDAVMQRSDDFDVIGAGGGQMFQMLCLGAEAHTTSDASAIPEPYVEIYDLFKKGKFYEARERQWAVIRLTKSFPRTENGEYAAEEKYILSLRGICSEVVNPLYRCLTNEEKRQIKNVLQAYGFQWAS